jgi:hypothetical protein
MFLKAFEDFGLHQCDPVGIRTQDPIIKSDVLYQLSYRINVQKTNKSDNFGSANVIIII